MHEARIVVELVTEMGYEQLEDWAKELRSEAAEHLLGSESIAIDNVEVQPNFEFRKPWNSGKTTSPIALGKARYVQE